VHKIAAEIALQEIINFFIVVFIRLFCPNNTVRSLNEFSPVCGSRSELGKIPVIGWGISGSASPSALKPGEAEKSA